MIVESVSVKKVGDKWVFSEGIDESAIAYAKITATMNSTGRIPLLWLILGWTVLKVKSNENYSNEQQAYAAGLVEGYITEDVIFTHSTNVYTEKNPSEHVFKGICYDCVDSKVIRWK